LDAHSYGMPCCTLAEDDCSQSLSHGQFCNVTSLILRSADISLLKHTQKKLTCQRSLRHQTKYNAKSNKQRIEKKKFLRCFKWGLTFVACGTAVVRDAFTAIVLTRHSTSLRYTFASLKSNELYEKRCHVNMANSRLQSRELGVYAGVI